MSNINHNSRIITIGTTLEDIRCATILPQHADLLVAAIRLWANYMFSDSLHRHVQQHNHFLVPPANINVTVPGGHEVGQYNGFVYVQPSEETEAEGPFYLITHGKLVGVFAHWVNVAPLVIGVKHATYEKVASSDQGCRLLINAIDDNIVLYIH
ncbi:hypothetical protein L210DRAFT_3641115 [Boletus edulis BED1]|uniref:Uncharacterized protein n=1 Tax=Boletus edulis BED1 TaxID=1328754 RepID=A0AAD4C5V1_BOLED|nr:hypothetical protein L210DRAFT_3641115 [Boletus edulis BED1]